MGDGDVMNTFKMNVQIVNVPRQTLSTIAVSSVELHSNLIQFEIEMCRNVFVKSRLGNIIICYCYIKIVIVYTL